MKNKKTATQTATASSWLEIDIIGLRRTLERKGKAWAIFELVQNSWDTDATRVDVTLTKPKNGKSILTCRDNAPDGYRDLSEAHTLFGSSSKKADPMKRGRFNAGEKFVLVMCEQAKVTSTTGQFVFQSNGKRKMTDVKTDAGTEFQGTLEMTEEEWLEVNRQVQRLFPPITTTFNGVDIPTRKPLHVFQETLPTEIANDRGILIPRRRKTEVRLYETLKGESPMIYERGIPVVEMDGKYHVSVEQKIPLNTERDNVTPGYLKAIHLMVVNEMSEQLTAEDAVRPWVRAAMEQTSKIKPEAVKTIITQRFGENAVLYDQSDIGANKEAVSKGATVVPRGAMSKAERETVKEAGAMLKAGEVDEYKTNIDDFEPAKTLTENEYDTDQKRYVCLIEVVSPILINHTVSVEIIDDKDVKLIGCTRWKKDSFVYTINLAFHDCSNWVKNYELLIHELAHHKVQSNDHLCREFYDTATNLGAKLAQLTLEQPELFPEARLAVAA